MCLHSRKPSSKAEARSHTLLVMDAACNVRLSTESVNKVNVDCPTKIVSTYFTYVSVAEH